MSKEGWNQEESQYEYVKNNLYRIFSPDPEPSIEFMRWLAQQYSLPINLKLIDIGVGTGEALPFYAQHGWTVTAYDPDEAFVKRACEKMRQERQSMTIKRGGFLDVDEAEGDFDMVVAINAPFAYLTDEDERREALLLVHSALQKNGILLLEIPNVLWFLWNKSEIELDEKPFQNGGMARNYRCYEFDLQAATMIMHNDYYVLENSKIALHISEKHTLAVLKLPEMKRLLTENGFKEVCIYPNYTVRNKYQRADGERIIMSAKKS